MSKYIISILFFFFLCYVVNAQQITFSKAIDLGGLELGWNVFATEDGYYVCGGTSLDTTVYHRLLAITKVNQYGEFEWVKKHGDTAYNLYSGFGSWERNAQNEFIVGGSIQYKDGSNSQVFLAKFDAQGDTIFTSKFGISGITTIGRDVIETIDYGFAIVGNTFLNSIYSVYLAKADENGILQWQETYGTFGGSHIQSFPNGDLLLGASGGTISEPDSSHGRLIKTDDSGSIIWEKKFDNPDFPSSTVKILKLNNTEIFLRQFIYMGAQLAEPTILRRLTSEGDSIWTKMLPFDEYEEHDVRSMRELSNGDIVIAGTYLDLNMSPQFLGGWLARMDADGNILWTRRYKYEESPLYPIDAYFYDVQPTPDNGFILSGFTVHYDQDIWLVKLDSMGCLEPGCYIDTSDTTGIIDITPQYLQSKAYPNPFDSRAVIEVNLSGRPVQNVLCRIYDMQGKVMSELKPKVQNHEQITFLLDNPNIASGSYFYKIVSNYEILARGKIVRE